MVVHSIFVDKMSTFLTLGPLTSQNGSQCVLSTSLLDRNVLIPHPVFQVTDVTS